MTAPRLLYTSFDETPSPKGASVHIDVFVRALAARFGAVTLVTPGPRDEPARDYSPDVRQLVLGCPDDNPLARANTFRAKLTALLRRERFDVIHFRSIFEGWPIARLKDEWNARLVYEVNGLPSIEMKYHHPGLLSAPELLTKLARQEDASLRAADRVVTISDVARATLIERGADPARTIVIRNGVDPARFPFRRSAAPTPDAPLQVVYVGTFSAWQGIEVLLRAARIVQRVRPIHVRLIGPASKRRRAELEKLAGHGLEGAIEFCGSRPQEQLAQAFWDSHVSLAPLRAIDRNTRQGCCPLKVLESMFAGCPVIASDLPVVRELATPHEHFLPCVPGRAGSLAEALLRMANEPDLGPRLSAAAYAHVSPRFDWRQATERLVRVYEELLARPPG